MSTALPSTSCVALHERAGWRVHRVPHRRWQREREDCLAEIDALLGGGSASAEELVAAAPEGAPG